ncbi:MAG: hypothetical protein R3B06_30695 [Kofleriaceae bacterium]
MADLDRVEQTQDFSGEHLWDCIAQRECNGLLEALDIKWTPIGASAISRNADAGQFFVMGAIVK